MRIGKARVRGFAYLLLLIAVASLAFASAVTSSLGAVAQRRDAERELLAIGMEFQGALQSYSGAASNADPNQVQGPRTLDELLKDPRVPGVRRHLRRVHDDPLTGSNAWGTVLNAQGGIVGVYSLAAGRPIKQSGFDGETARFGNAQSYREWVFGFPPAAPPRKP